MMTKKKKKKPKEPTERIFCHLPFLLFSFFDIIVNYFINKFILKANLLTTLCCTGWKKREEKTSYYVLFCVFLFDRETYIKIKLLSHYKHSHIFRVIVILIFFVRNAFGSPKAKFPTGGYTFRS